MPIGRRLHLPQGQLFASVTFCITGLVFFPILRWLTQQTASHEQLLHAFIVFAFTGFLLILQQRIPLRAVWDFSPIVQNFLIAGYALLILAWLSQFALLSLLALGLCIAAFLLYVMGSSQQRFIFASVFALVGFTLFTVYLPVLDWPLRALAGKWSAAGLSLLGSQADLSLYQSTAEPMLILYHAGRPYHVAAECNGFGLLTSSLLMVTMIVFYRCIGTLDRLLAFIVAIFIAFTFNTLRIIAIVLIAPRIADDAYMFMHETVGLIATYGGLAILYFLLIGLGRDAVNTP